MKKHLAHIPWRHRLWRTFALALALLMLTTSTAFAAAPASNDNAKTTDPPPYTINRYGEVTIFVSSTAIKTDWDNDGCQLDTCFLTSNSLLRRLRLTFNSAFDLYDSYLRIVQANTTEAVLQKTYRRYGCLADYLSRATIRGCTGNDGLDLLYNLRQSREYRNSTTVSWMVEQGIAEFENSYAASLRRTLELFYPPEILIDMSAQQLQWQAAFVVNTPEYITFRNTLFDHDCGTVKSLLARGYSLDYISRLYSNQAKAAVEVIWPNYKELMNEYWRNNDRPW